MFVGFDVDRCLEAAGVLFSTTETKMMGRMRLLKLLYLANRKSLKETGDPIVVHSIERGFWHTFDDGRSLDQGAITRRRSRSSPALPYI